MTMAHKVGINEEITLTGGVAKNLGLVTTMRNKVLKNINIPTDPQIVGALGAAILAQRYIN